MTAGTIINALGAWLGLNLAHTLWVETRRRAWERRLARDPDGLLPGAASFSVGNGPIAILFIHGFADTPAIWTRVAARLAATGRFACRAMRLPGSGEPRDGAKRQSFDRWRAAVDRELAALRSKHKAVWAAGHSMGAALAADAALRDPDAVDGLVALAPLIQVSNRRSPLLPPRFWFLLARLALPFSHTFESCFSAEGTAADDPSFTYTRDRFIPFCVYRGLFQLVRAIRGRSADLAQPIFAVTAARDPVVDTPAALRWLDGCRGPKTVRSLDDIGHVVPLELRWRELTDEIAAFILNQTKESLHEA